MQLSDFHYELPDSAIAQQPAAHRSDSRMLCLDRGDGRLEDAAIRDFPQRLQPQDLLVLNDTRVLPARLFGHKQTGGAVEIFLERILDSRRMSVKLRASKTPRPGSRLTVGAVELTVLERQGELFTLQASTDTAELLQAQGHVPLPPYIQRQDLPVDRERYQTVWARQDGAVAAPTAGLHFDQPLLERVRQTGCDIGYVTLHVGAGTYQRVRQSDIDQHELHFERLNVDPALCAQVAATRERGGRIIAVGTTVVRSLETAARSGELQPYSGETNLFIKPGFGFNVVDALLTNFHEPESTLLMLVSAFAGRQSVLAAYHHALRQGYRFLSYGDAMFIA